MEDELVLNSAQNLTLQVLNGMDVVVIAAVVVLCMHNVIRYIIIGRIRQNFIVLFYAMALFVLLSWMVTSIAQS